MKTKTSFIKTESYGSTLPSGKKLTGSWFRVVQVDKTPGQDGVSSCWWEGSSAKEASRQLRICRLAFKLLPDRPHTPEELAAAKKEAAEQLGFA